MSRKNEGVVVFKLIVTLCITALCLAGCQTGQGNSARNVVVATPPLYSDYYVKEEAVPAAPDGAGGANQNGGVVIEVAEVGVTYVPNGRPIPITIFYDYDAGDGTQGSEAEAAVRAMDNLVITASPDVLKRKELEVKKTETASERRAREEREAAQKERKKLEDRINALEAQDGKLTFDAAPMPAGVTIEEPKIAGAPTEALYLGELVRVVRGNRVTVYIDPDRLGSVEKIVLTAIGKEGQTYTIETAMEKKLADRKTIDISAKPKELKTNIHVWPVELAADEFGNYFADAFYVCDVNFINESQNDMLLYGASLSTQVSYSVTLEAANDLLNKESYVRDFELDKDAIRKELEFPERRRPMSFSDVLAIFDYQRQSTRRQQSLRWMQFAGTLAAGANIFIDSVDYPTGVAFFNGIFLPDFEKNLLWDILLHLRNLESRSLREVEEIPMHGQLHRIVFFPRKAIVGLHPLKPVYISEIYRDATVRAESIAKLGSTPDERNKALAAILAKSAVSKDATWVETKTYTDALATLQAAQLAAEEAQNADTVDDKANAEKKALLRSALGNLVRDVIQDPKLPLDPKIRSALQLLTDFVSGPAPDGGVDGDGG